MRRIAHWVYAGLMTCTLSVNALGQSWRLADTPRFEYGAAQGNTALAFGSIAGVLRLEGTLVVADGQSNHLVFIDERSGSHRVVGRVGSGPGEFRTIRSVMHCHPLKAYVYDPAAMRVSVFNARGVFERAIDVRGLSATGIPPYDLVCNSSGSFVAVNRAPNPPPIVGPRRPEVVVRVYVDSARSWSAGTTFATERYFDGSNDFPRPMGLRTSVAVGSRFWVVGTGDTDSVSVHPLEQAGPRTRVFSAGFPRRAITAAVARDYADAEIRARAGRADTSALRALYNSAGFPDRLPAYRRILVGPSDQIWVEQHPLPTDARVRWTVFTPQGRRLGQMDVPQEFRVEVVTDTVLIGVWQGEDDVLRIRGYVYSRE